MLDAQTQEFYRRVMDTLARRDVPFLVAGAYALRHHTGISRQTKDLDLFVMRDDIERALAVLAEEGFQTDLPFTHWLGKVYDDGGSGEFIDIIFSSGNGVATVDAAFFDHAPHGTIFGVPIRWCPVEEMIWSKAFVMERERFDGADVAHLLHSCAASLDWQRLVERFGAHWRLLLVHVTLHGFIYPNERERVPLWVVEELTDRMRREASADHEETPVCSGTLLSRQQFLVDICERGYLDGRLTEGVMTENEVEDWTAAILQKE
ncbi:MAG: nucleotidyltransferase [Polyangiales bacterium]